MKGPGPMILREHFGGNYIARQSRGQLAGECPSSVGSDEYRVGARLAARPRDRELTGPAAFDGKYGWQGVDQCH